LRARETKHQYFALRHALAKTKVAQLAAFVWLFGSADSQTIRWRRAEKWVGGKFQPRQVQINTHAYEIARALL
jgi:hypothetical protein